jgi:cytochrome c oxidase subunit 3
MIVTTDIDNREGALRDPKNFNLMLGIIAIVMLFAGLTSAYIVKRAEGNWQVFALPVQFIISTAIVILSSATMQWAWFATKNDELGRIKTALLTTIILGIGFCISQVIGWKQLVIMNHHFLFTDDVASSFLYVITGLHALHIAGGIIALIITLALSFRLKVHKKNMRTITLCTTYWHFMGALWIYLYLFLFLNR